MAKKSSASKGSIQSILALIAGVLCIVQGVLNIITPSWAGLWGGIIAILLGVVILMSTGYITDKLGIPFNLITAIIFCILCFVLASWWGGICLLIAVILFLLKK